MPVDKIKQAAEFGSLMGKLAANDQFIGPKGAGPKVDQPPPFPALVNGHLPVGYDPLARHLKGMPKLPYRPTPIANPNTATAEAMLSGRRVPEGVSAKNYVMDLDRQTGERMSDSRPGSLNGEVQRLKGEEDSSAIRAVGMSLISGGAGSLVSKGLTRLGSKPTTAYAGSWGPSVLKNTAPSAYPNPQ